MENKAMVVVDENGEVMESAIQSVPAMSDLFSAESAAVFTSEGLIFDDTPAGKFALHKIKTSPAYKLSNERGKTLKITGFICQWVQVKSRVTGELETAPRIILVDENGEGHVCVSNGMLNALKMIVQDVGQPSKELPFTVKIGSGKTDKGEFLTLELVGI